MQALAARVILAWGWARAAIAFAAGASGALAMPPFGVLPALAVSLGIAVWLLDGAARKGRSGSAGISSAAIVGWWWGFGYFVAGLWWLGAAFLVEAEQFAWALPFGVVGLPALLAVFPAFGFALARLLWSPGVGRLFALAFGLAASEWLRGHLFTGFPWNTLGMALGQNLWLMQSASLVGVYGLTALAVLIAAAPATLGTGATPSQRIGPPAFAAVALAVIAGFGAWRLPPEPTPAVAGVRLGSCSRTCPKTPSSDLEIGTRSCGAISRSAIARRRRVRTASPMQPTSSGRNRRFPSFFTTTRRPWRRSPPFCRPASP